MRLTIFILFSLCYAEVVYVPAEYPVIQTGLGDAASEYDIVVVYPGIFLIRMKDQGFNQTLKVGLLK